MWLYLSHLVKFSPFGLSKMAGWHHWLDGHNSKWTLGVGDGQGGLASCDSWGRKESDTTERLNWTDLMCVSYLIISNFFDPHLLHCRRILSHLSYLGGPSKELWENLKFIKKKKKLSLQVIKFKYIYTRVLKGHCWPSLARLSAWIVLFLILQALSSNNTLLTFRLCHHSYFLKFKKYKVDSFITLLVLFL